VLKIVMRGEDNEDEAGGLEPRRRGKQTILGVAGSFRV
jgi:hypothetical protein